MSAPEPTIRVNVDPANPGQFLACCGLLELADRLRPGAEGWFSDDAREFRIAASGTLGELLGAVCAGEVRLVNTDDIYSSAVDLPAFGLRLDWWSDAGWPEFDPGRGSRLKPWAGTMESAGIARAMHAVLARPEAQTPDLFDYACVVPSVDDPARKKEPYHFDCRRGANALPLDIGFTQDPLGIRTTAHPAVEFLCLVGLQRHRPCPTDTPRVFDYFTWGAPCDTAVSPVAVCGLLGDPAARGYRFENAFRTGQKKHKAFAPAVPLPTRTGESR
jgi:hypothetical protein